MSEGEEQQGEEPQAEDVPEDLVFLVGAGDLNEAAILRGYLEHHGIYVYVQGEEHRSMLGMLGAYVELRLMVPGASVDDAKQVLELFYSEQEDASGPEFRGAFRDEHHDEEEEDKYDEDVVDKTRLKHAVRRARLAGLMFPLGGAHFAAKAPIRGLMLAALSIAGVVLFVQGKPMMIGLWVLSVAYDLMSVRGPLFDTEVARARAEHKQLREAASKDQG